MKLLEQLSVIDISPRSAGIEIGSRFHLVAIPTELDDEPDAGIGGRQPPDPVAAGRIADLASASSISVLRYSCRPHTHLCHKGLLTPSLKAGQEFVGLGRA